MDHHILVIYTWSLFLYYSSALSCYSFDGNSYPDQQLCPGSSACCGVNATCQETRLCKNKGDGIDTFVRGPCAVIPWDSKVCATICLYAEQQQKGLFPRAILCKDGSYCCNNDPTCCAAGTGNFLDSKGNIVTSSPVPSTASRTASASPSTSSVEVTSATRTSISILLSTSSLISSTSVHTASSSPTNASKPTDSLSTGAKAGLGVGVAFGTLAIAVLSIIAWLLWKRHSRAASESSISLEQTPFYSAATYPAPIKMERDDPHAHAYELPPHSPQEMETPVLGRK